MTVTEALRELGVAYAEGGSHRHVTQGFVGVDCPLCSPRSGKMKLGISLSGRFATCWSCGPQPLFKSLAELSGRPYGEVERLFGGLAPGRTPPQERSGRLVIPDGVGPLLPVHTDYLRGRGFDPEELVKLWGLMGIGLAARLAWRLWVPISHRGDLVSWTTRAVHADSPRRYVAAGADEEKVPAKQLLYGGDYLRHAVVVVEGPADAWRVGPGAAATLGVVVSAEQKALLAQVPVRVVCFDSEPAAQRRAQKLVADLEVFPGRTYRVELDAPDPGSAPAREVTKLRKAFLD